MRYPDLIDVTQEVRRLRKEVSDAEWNHDPAADVLRRELEYYENLQAKGHIYEPAF